MHITPTTPSVGSALVTLLGLLIAVTLGRVRSNRIGGGVWATTLGVLAGCGAGFAAYRALRGDES